MLKVCFISFYEIKEYILSLKTAFQTLLYSVENYPLYRYAYDANDKLDDYPLHMVKYLQQIRPDVIFWIFLDVDPDAFKTVRSSLPDCRLVMYLADKTPINDVFLSKFSHFDYLIAHDMRSVTDIMNHSKFDVNRILCVPSCYDDALFSPDANLVDKYKCDLAFLSYDYGEDVQNLLVKLVEFCNQHQLTLKLYGSSQMRQRFSDVYMGGYGYLEHPLINKAARLIVCDDPNQIIKILGQRKLFAGVGPTMAEFPKLYIGMHHQIDCAKLKNLLANSDRLIAELGSTVDKLTESTYRSMIGKFHKKMCQDYFDVAWYQQTFYPELTFASRQEAVRHFINTGMVDRAMPVKFVVPRGFNDVEYAKSLEAAKTVFYDNRAYLYYHWRRYSGNLAYIEDDRLDLSDMSGSRGSRPNISFKNLCSVFKVLMDLHAETEDPNELLSKLASTVSESPEVDLNLCVKMFFKWRQQVSQMYLER